MLCNLNREWLQWRMEQGVTELPAVAVTGLLWFVKQQSHGEVTRSTLYKLPAVLLQRVSDEGFDNFYEQLQMFLAEL